MSPLGLDEDASAQEVLDHYGIDVDADEFATIVEEARTVFEVQQAVRRQRTQVKPALAALDLLDGLAAPHRQLVAERCGR